MRRWMLCSMVMSSGSGTGFGSESGGRLANVGVLGLAGYAWLDARWIKDKERRWMRNAMRG